MRLQLQIVVLLLGRRHTRSIPRLVCRRLALRHCRLVEGLDTSDAILPTSLILRETADFIAHLALDSSVLRVHCELRLRGTVVCLELGYGGVFQISVLRCGQHHAVAVVRRGGRRLVEVEDALRRLLTAVVLVPYLSPSPC